MTEAMTDSVANDTNDSIQVRRLGLSLLASLAAVVLLTPLSCSVMGIDPRKASVSILRFAFLICVSLSWNRRGPGLAAEAGLAPASQPWKIWLRGFFTGAIPLAAYVLLLTALNERVYEGPDEPGEFWWAVIKYLPLSVVIGFLEDMLFFGFLATLLGGRFVPCVLVYAISHFLAPSKAHIWQATDWSIGIEALQAMGDSLAAATSEPIEVFGLILVGGVLAVLCLKTGNIWAAMGVHGGWYYVRTIARKLGEDLDGDKEWLFGSDRFYDGALGWLAILSTGVIFWLTWKAPKPQAR